ncbi:ammonium transporter [Leucothrix sargassi]|nr:ammonium transporter [Leucothrix sargassi]
MKFLTLGFLLLIVPGLASAEIDAEIVELFDILWLTIAALLVFFMQAAFALVESGMSRSKNAVNVMMKNYFDVCTSTLIFAVFGYGIMYGESVQGFIGIDKFFMSSFENNKEYALLLFNAMFAATAATISSGAMAERTKFVSYAVSALFVSGFIYPLLAHWAWNDAGWLSKIGFYDFAGSTVVHSVGAWVALAGIIVVGPRAGRFDPDTGEVREIPGHNLMLVTLGGFIFWFGFFAFNAGSGGGMTTDIGKIALNTALAGAAGALGVSIVNYLRGNKQLVTSTINGSLSGLVAIAAGCLILEPMIALLTGFIAGALFSYGQSLMQRFKLDDVVDAVTVHGFCGVWGTLAVALFYSGDWFNLERITAQLIGILVTFIWSFGSAFVLFNVIDRIWGLRSSAIHQQRGLDISEHNEVGYPEFQQKTFKVNQ